ncbi:hypothetical protein BDB01DRAFT_444020 [Pilobolus umbonatus]|nr:hypothetical protein BDB01DRAFT_444020 [Pilobolus umbonatus]
MAEYASQVLSVVHTLEQQIADIKDEQDKLQSLINQTKDGSLSDEQMSQLTQRITKVSAYHTKLLSLKSTMNMLSGRNKQLQKKADKLKQTKLQYLSDIDHIKQMERERDRMIIAKTVPKSPSTPSSPTDTPTTFDSSMVQSNDFSIAAISVIKTIPKVKSIGKKKKIKAREVLLKKDDPSTWKPKRSMSQKDLQ